MAEAVDQWQSLNDSFKIDQPFTGNCRLIFLDRFPPVYHFGIPKRDAVNETTFAYQKGSL